MKYTEFFWDFDGTLFDSYPAMARGFHRALTELGISLEDERFTVNGETVSSYTGAWGMNGAEAIADGAYAESSLRSAPYFDLRIDGITELNA